MSDSNQTYARRIFGTGESIPSGTYRIGSDIAPGWYSLADPAGIVATPVFFPFGAVIQSAGSFVLFNASMPAPEVQHG